MFWNQRTLRKHFLHHEGCRSVFPAKNRWNVWRSCSWLVRSQVNIVDEKKLYSSSHSSFEVMVAYHAVWDYHGELSPLCWPMLARSFFQFSICWANFSDVMGFRKLSDLQQTTKQHPGFLFWFGLLGMILWVGSENLALRNVLQFPLSPTTFCNMSQSYQEMLLTTEPSPLL